MIEPEHPYPPDELEYLRECSRFDVHPDNRLRMLVYVDGRLVDAWTGSVRHTQWEEVAEAFDREKRPAAPPPPPPDPPHVHVLRWLEGVAGGHAALRALDDGPTPSPSPPDIGDELLRSAYQSVVDHLDRVAVEFFDDEVHRVLLGALVALWEEAPETVTRRAPNEVAGGLVWVVGRANDLFRGGLTQTTVQRELWLRRQLSVVGQGLAPLLRGVDLHRTYRPDGCPDLMAFANSTLLTAGTRRLLVRWRDEALRAQQEAAQS